MRLLLLINVMVLSLFTQAQKVTGKLNFQPGQVLNITTKTTTINVFNAMGRDIEIKADIVVDHQYKVTNTTEENHTLGHEINRIRLNSEGITGDLSIDSDSEKDLKGRFGEPIKEMKSMKYNMVIDPSGNTILAMSDGSNPAKKSSSSDALAQFTGELMDVIRVPKAGEASFFKVLPSTPVSLGDGWTTTHEYNGTKTEEAYSIAEITDDIILLNYLANSTTSTVQQAMGTEFTINVKNKIEGKIKVDRKTGIVKEKITKKISTGSSSSSFGEFPVNSTSETIMTIN